jgi:hypothetical protein
MALLVDGSGIQAFALPLKKFIAARLCTTEHSWSPYPTGGKLEVELQTALALLVFSQVSGKKPARFTSLFSQTPQKSCFRFGMMLAL